jgi:thiamine-phosphate pyrophosphorylase
MQGLYAILDTDTLERRGQLNIAPFIEALLDARPAALQIRDKRGGARRTLEILRVAGPLCARAAVPLFANDRADLALLAGCDGVHLGQEDLPPDAARSLSLAPGAVDPPRTRGLMIGLSTHTMADLDAAIVAQPDYIAIGPVFETTSKERPDPTLGLEVLGVLASHVRRVCPGLPIVAIGGITLETAGAVGAFVDAVAVISALLPEGAGPLSLDAVRGRARALRDAVLGGQA